MQIVAHEEMSPGYTPLLALSGHYVVWIADHLKLANLQTGLNSVLDQNPGIDPAIYDETVLWAGTGNASGDRAILGLTLRDARPRILVQREGLQWHPTLAGDQLVWANERGPNAGLLSAVPLAAALAGTQP